MKRLETRAVPARPDRASTQLLLDTPDVRVVAFHLLPGQEVQPHTSPSSVLLQVVDGEGEFSGPQGELSLKAGQAVAYEPEELHGIRAGEEALRFVAIITPRPS